MQIELSDEQKDDPALARDFARRKSAPSPRRNRCELRFRGEETSGRTGEWYHGHRRARGLGLVAAATTVAYAWPSETVSSARAAHGCGQ